MDLGILSALSLGMTQHWGKDGLVSGSVGQFKIRTCLVGYYEKLETFFISDLKEINMMIC